MSVTTHTTTSSGVEPLQVAEGMVARQGDLILVPAPESAGKGDIAFSPIGPDGAVLIEGRAAHVLRGDAAVARAGETILVRVGDGGAVLSHERDGAQAEHAPLALAPGCDWVVLVQRTLDPRGNIRRAAD